MLEEDAQRLVTLQEEIWEREWAYADLCLWLIQHRDRDYLKALGQVIGTSHRNLERKGLLADSFPPGTRAKDYAPRTHASWLRRGTTGPQSA